MRLNQSFGAFTLLAFLLLTFSACEKSESTAHSDDVDLLKDGIEARKTYSGESVSLGDGHLWTYIHSTGNGKPKEIGVQFTESMLSNLPTAHSDMSHCYDLDGDGTYGAGECFNSHERVLMLPSEVQANTPFKWVLVNWNPIGHIPNGVYNVPHFDMHFYTQTLAERNDINTGPCLNLMDCDDLATALVPVPSQYISPGYIYPPDGGTVEPAMGGHMINTNSPEICCMAPFTHTFIYGAYDGHITFYEPMLTLELLESKENVKTNLSLPQAWEEEGYYPTEYEIRYHPNNGTYTVSLQKFKYRTAH